MPETPDVRVPNLAGLVADRILDAEIAALLWLLVEGRVPTVVTGAADLDTRSAIASAVLGATPSREWVLLDVDATATSLDELATLLRGDMNLGITLSASDLRGVLASLEGPPDPIPEDAVRRLGVVLVVEATPRGPRARAVHYLRPTERDAEGHVQRRPPAVLATWEPETDSYDHFAWGMTPELGDRVDRSQADLEERQHDRAAFLAPLARLASEGVASAVEYEARVAAYLETEPPRTPASVHERARPSPFHGGVGDPHVH